MPRLGLIHCPACGVEGVAFKHRLPTGGWENVCDNCGTGYGAPPPGLVSELWHQRRARNRMRARERAGQRRLFP